MEPDLLLLDEPTNHLDLESLVWFQEYLEELSGRDPHDLARSRIPELSSSAASSRSRNRSCIRYRGNWDSYVEQKAAREEQQLSAYKNQQKEIASLQQFADRFRAKASKASQAQSKLKQIDRMEKIEAPIAQAKDDQIPFSAAAAERAARDHAEGRRSRLRRSGRLSRIEFRSGARAAHRAGRPERRRQIDAAEIARRRPAGAERRRASSGTTCGSVIFRSIASRCST